MLVYKYIYPNSAEPAQGFQLGRVAQHTKCLFQGSFISFEGVYNEKMVVVLTKAGDDDDADNWFDVSYSDRKATAMERIVLFINKERADSFPLGPGLAAHVKTRPAELFDSAGLAFNPMLIVQSWSWA